VETEADPHRNGELPRQRTDGELLSQLEGQAGVHHRTYGTRAEARGDLIACIEGFYNSRRFHTAIVYRSQADIDRMTA
jgi:hypothetical protein